MNHVPCNGCTRCCRNDAVRILPHEDASQWRTVPHDYRPGALMLEHKPNGPYKPEPQELTLAQRIAMAWDRVSS